LPTEPEKNVAGAALLSMLGKIDEISVLKSKSQNTSNPAAESVRARRARRARSLRQIFWTKDFRKLELVEFAMDGEFALRRASRRQCRAVHFRRLYARSLGRSARYCRARFPPLFVTVIHPQIEIKTSEARKILPRENRLKTRSAMEQRRRARRRFAKSDYAN
jgi:homoserine kinase